MAATEAICFAEPAQLRGYPFRRAGSYVTRFLPPLWQYACRFISSQLTLQTRAVRP